MKPALGCNVFQAKLVSRARPYWRLMPVNVVFSRAKISTSGASIGQATSPRHKALYPGQSNPRFLQFQSRHPAQGLRARVPKPTPKSRRNVPDANQVSKAIT